MRVIKIEYNVHEQGVFYRRTVRYTSNRTIEDPIWSLIRNHGGGIETIHLASSRVDELEESFQQMKVDHPTIIR